MEKQKNDEGKKNAEESFEMVAKEWLALLKPQLKESSIIKYRNILNSYILPEFREVPVPDIKRDRVSFFSIKLLQCGGSKEEGLAPKTVADIISVLKSILEYAHQVKKFSIDDMKGISVKRPHNPMRILSRAEQKRLDTYLSDNINFCNLGIRLCLYTGLRIGEICALRWGDILYEEQALCIDKTMQRLQKGRTSKQKTKILISSPKSDNSIRIIPLPDKIFDLILAYRQSDDTYFLTGKKNIYMEPRTLHNRFKAILKLCGIKDASFHVLRHTFATRCIELGFDVKSLSEILGHASVNITMNRYVHPSMEMKQKNMNMLSGLL